MESRLNGLQIAALRNDFPSIKKLAFDTGVVDTTNDELEGKNADLQSMASTTPFFNAANSGNSLAAQTLLFFSANKAIGFAPNQFKTVEAHLEHSNINPEILYALLVWMVGDFSTNPKFEFMLERILDNELVKKTLLSDVFAINGLLNLANHLGHRHVPIFLQDSGIKFIGFLEPEKHKEPIPEEKLPADLYLAVREAYDKKFFTHLRKFHKECDDKTSKSLLKKLILNNEIEVARFWMVLNDITPFNLALEWANEEASPTQEKLIRELISNTWNVEAAQQVVLNFLFNGAKTVEDVSKLIPFIFNDKKSLKVAINNSKRYFEPSPILKTRITDLLKFMDANHGVKLPWSVKFSSIFNGSGALNGEHKSDHVQKTQTAPLQQTPKESYIETHRVKIWGRKEELDKLNLKYKTRKQIEVEVPIEASVKKGLRARTNSVI